MNMNTVKQIIAERNPEAAFLPDMFDRALVGTAQASGGKLVAAYNSDVFLEILIDEQGFDEMAALTYYENTANSKPGPNRPVFVSDFRKISPVRLETVDTSTTIDEFLRSQRS